MSSFDIISKKDVTRKRLDRAEARKLVARIANFHPYGIRFSRHALKAMKEDDLLLSDIVNVIKNPDAKIFNEGELEKSSFRYRLETEDIVVIIAFVSLTSFVVVTVWRKT